MNVINKKDLQFHSTTNKRERELDREIIFHMIKATQAK